MQITKCPNCSSGVDVDDSRQEWICSNPDCVESVQYNDGSPNNPHEVIEVGEKCSLCYVGYTFITAGKGKDAFYKCDDCGYEFDAMGEWDNL